MKKILLETSFSKIYMIVMIIITLLILGGYFSYAMFTVTKEKENAISIVTGNLTYKLEVDGEEGNTLTVPANSRQDFIVTLTNPNNRAGRFNFYYEGSLPEGVDMGYIEKESYNVPPTETGISLEQVDTAGSSNTYIVRVSNTTSSSVTINLGVEVGLDYNDLELPDNGHLLRKITSTGIVSEVIKDDIMNRLNYEDEEQTFVTGSNPYNYIWYSGKLWRAVSIDPSDNSVKLVTQWSISAVPYDNDSSAFAGSYMESWLNDTTVDGFLGNLRDPEAFIKMNSKWNASQMSDTSKPPSEEEGGTIIEDAVGILNIYEYNMGGASGSYLDNKTQSWTLTPYNSTNVRYIYHTGAIYSERYTNAVGVRPSINLKPEIKVVSGNGTIDSPYRLEGDNDSNLSGTLLNTRYSGEYITFGTGENNLYRIVSHETEELTKITSAEPLKENGKFKTMAFGDSVYYSNTNEVGSFLNGEYLDSGTYLTSEQVNTIEDNTTWYLGTVGSGASYRLAKYGDINMSNLTSNVTIAKVGLLRLGELMGGQYNNSSNNANCTYLTPINSANIWNMMSFGQAYGWSPSYRVVIRPALNLKSNVIITGGDGTKENPFTLSVQ